MFVKAVIRWLKIGLAMLFVCVPGQLTAQQFEIGNHPFQVHGFVTQGFAYSDQNNYLTMPTSEGSFALTDAGLNVSTQINDKFRVGAQAYMRRIGKLGNGLVTIDWAEGEYRFTDWLGVRAGRVKTELGLFNSTQDMEFLHTWALLPQSMYPIDLRETSLSHLGGDVFGNIHAGKLGTLGYTVYAGQLAKDFHGGYEYGDAAVGIYDQEMSGNARGADLRLTTGIPGLMVGSPLSNRPNR